PPAVGEIFAPAKYCGAEKRKGIQYPKTRACTEARVACPDPEIITGLLFRSTLSRQLYGGDITGSVSLSTDVLALARSQFGALDDRNQRQWRATNFTESFGSSGDHLLSPKAVPVWEELPAAVRIDHASTLMGALEQSALLLADYTVDQHKKLQYDYWGEQTASRIKGLGSGLAMEIDVHRPEEYVNPEERCNRSLQWVR
ncbi:hypothetical protein OSTOST_09029, partial [Ostertagia ostertagi]